MKRFSNNRKGGVLIFVAVAMVAFAAITSLVIDVAHLRVVKMQLQFAADAAARSAAAGMSSGTATSDAIAAAALISVDGTPVALQNSDVVTGTWSNSTFTAGGASPNAVRVKVRRTAARGNAVDVWWGSLIGKSSADITVAATATGKATQLAGFIGYGGVDMKNNTFFGSYDSRNTKDPTSNGAGKKARVGSNTLVNGKNNDTIQGDIVLGPHATADPTISLTGANLYQGTDLPSPAVPAWSPPGAISDLVVTNDTVMPGGTYWYNTITVNANLSFSGTTTIHVNGDVFLDGTIAAASGNPVDLTIYQSGAHTFGDAASNGMNLTAFVIAPSSDFVTKNNLNFYGSGIFNSITTKNNANFYYDITLGAADGTPMISTVK
jgi:Flp pilus assembly protein TadG